MSFADPVHLSPVGHLPGDGPNEACEGCEDGIAAERCDGLHLCADCAARERMPVCVERTERFDVEAGGHIDEEGQAFCEWCIEERDARELRQAHPAPPTTVNEYLKAKGRAA
jgi:hypothetical protein